LGEDTREQQIDPLYTFLFRMYVFIRRQSCDTLTIGRYTRQ
jgi:hypothetical protein